MSSPAPLTEAATLSPAALLGWTTPHSSTLTVVDQPVGTQGLQTITAKPFPSETSTVKSNKVTQYSFHSSADKIYEGIRTSASTNIIKTQTRTSAYTSFYIPYHGQNLNKLLHGRTQTPDPGMDSVSANNVEISTSFPSSEGSQAVQRQQVDSPNLTSALQHAHLKGYSVSSHITQQILNETAYVEKEDKKEVDSQVFVHKIIADTITSPLTSHAVNPAVSRAITLRPTGSFIAVSTETPPSETSFFQSAGTTPIHSGTVSSEHASNPGDLLMAAGHGSPRVPAININYNQGVIAGAEPEPISAQDHQNNSLSLKLSRPESTSFSILGLITRPEKASSTSDSDSPHFPINGVINIQDLETQPRSPQVTTQKTPTDFSSISKRVYISGLALPVRLAHKTFTPHPTQPTYLLPSFVSRSPNHNNIDDITGISANTEVNFADRSKATSSSPRTRPLQTRSLLMFSHKFNLSSPNKSKQTVTLAEANINKSERTNHSIHSTSDAETSTGNVKTVPSSSVHMSYGKSPAGHVHTNTEKSSVYASLNKNEESALITDTVFDKKVVPSGQLTTQFPSFITTKDVFTLNKSFKGSSRGYPPENPFSPVTFDAALEPLKILSRDHDVTLVGRYEQSSPSSWLEIISTPRANSSSSSQGPITSVSSDKSTFYLGRQATNLFTTSSAAASPSSDRQSSTGTLGAIFSFGTKLMAPYTKWKPTKHVSFQSSAFESENTSTGFDRANSHLPADGPSDEHPKLGNEQKHNVHILNLSDPTLVASDPYSVYPTVGEHPFITYVKGTSQSKEQSLILSPANLRSSVAVSVHRRDIVNTATPSAWGSESVLPLSHITTDSVASSQTTSAALVNNSNPHLAANTAVTLSNSAAHSFSDTHKISSTASKVKRLTPHEELMPSSALTFSSSSSKPLSPSFSGAKAHQVTSSALSEAAKTGMYAASSSIKAVPPTFSSLLPSLKASVDSDQTQQVTDTFVVLTEAGTDGLNAGTARADALTFPKEKEASLVPSEFGRIVFSAGPTERTSQVPPLSLPQDTTTASVKLTTTTVDSTTKTKNPTTNMPSPSVTTGPTQTTTTTTPQPATVTRRTTTTTTIRTQTSRRTFTPPVPRTSPPKAATTNFISPFTTTTTEAPPQQCNITERMWVKTGTVSNASAAALKKS